MVTVLLALGVVVLFVVGKLLSSLTLAQIENDTSVGDHTPKRDPPLATWPRACYDDDGLTSPSRAGRVGGTRSMALAVGSVSE